MSCLASGGLTLGLRLRRWSSIKPILAQRVLFAGKRLPQRDTPPVGGGGALPY